jgi:glycosyltransferase involved in cell wall biosynthesis
MAPVRMSVVVPAYDEAEILPRTLDQLRRCAAAVDTPVEIVVVDNGSTDGTAEIAAAHGARVVTEPDRRGVARARNAGAAATEGEVLVFVDADVWLPHGALARVAREMAAGGCVGGAFEPDYRPRRSAVRAYLRLWWAVSRVARMAQGACQFFSREAFEELGGYDEHYFVGEDGELWWRLQLLARRRGVRVAHVRDLQVVPSCRRYDQWPLWRTVLMTNPVTCATLARTRRPWSAGWYDAPPR